MIIGIDLGARNALCAVRTVEGQIIIPNRWGNISTPSVVAYADNTFLAGEDAVKAESRYPKQTWWDLKRKIGTQWRASYEVNGKLNEAKAEEMIIPLLKILREDAEVYLNTFVYSCVITVPAYFNSLQRFAVNSAAKEAGFSDVVRILNEPTAAVLSVGNKEGRFLVLDFGAGAADISVVEKESNAWHVLESVETKNIGGYDFDVLFAEWIIKRAGLCGIKENAEKTHIWNLFRLQAEKVKIALSTCESYELLPFIELEKFKPFIIEREDLNRLIRFHLRRIVNWVKILWEAHKPDSLLLVGGSSKIPLLRQILEKEIIPTGHIGYCMEESVVIGAAIHSSTTKDEILIDVLSHDIILKYDNTCTRVFQKGITLPASVKEYLLVSDVRENSFVLLQGDIEVQSIALDDVKLGEEIIVRISIDASGLFRIFVIRPSNKKLNQSRTIQIINKSRSDSIQKIKELEAKIPVLFNKLNDSQLNKLLDLISKARTQNDDDLTLLLKNAEKEIFDLIEKN